METQRVYLGLIRLLMATACVLASVGAMAATTMKPDQRVACATALEDLNWSYIDWPASNPGPKPLRSAVLSEAELRVRIDDQLRMESALAVLYGMKLDRNALQIELNRIARNTKAPDRLREQFARLGNHADRIGECLVRPLLVERRLREAYAFDQRAHGLLKLSAQAALEWGAEGEWLRRSGGLETRVVYRQRADSPAPPKAAATGAIEIELSAEELAVERSRLHRASQLLSAAALPASAPRVRETAEAFIEETVLRDEADGLVVRVRSWGKVPFDAWWNAQRPAYAPARTESVNGMTLAVIAGKPADFSKAAADSWMTQNVPSPRIGHSAVWTGSEMIVWGGYGGSYLSTGARYNPVNDSWTATSTVGAPTARQRHTAIWTGDKMIVWGGSDGNNLATGARYDPVTDQWTATNVNGAPAARQGHSAIWTGSQMVVWGGKDGGVLATGARYNPVSDSWLATSAGGAPLARELHSAVWTGSDMIIWGGIGGTYLNSGARYNPVSDSWLATAASGAPLARAYHTAVWTGTEMLVWGGVGSSNFATGARYNPLSDSWTDTSISGAPSERQYHTAVWTGSEMIVWGGYRDANLLTGARYNPASDSWTATSTSGNPVARRLHTAIWTGNELIVWGGVDESSFLASGGRYDPLADSWASTSGNGAPTARQYHTAVWTGSEMIVWGGVDGATNLATGARYSPASDSWTATSTLGAPTARFLHSAVWTGSAMIAWGGQDGGGISATGARYNPVTDIWTATSATGAPTARYLHTAIWTGSAMVVWGGYGASGLLATGARYNPGSNTWAATNASGAPSARQSHTAVWTGSEMIVWGGNGGSYLDSGARYNPVSDSWTATSASGAPAARREHAVVWTGSEMIVWGGYNGSALATGARYNPVGGTWTDISASGAPSARYLHTSIWTGSELVVWGGRVASSLATGGRYNPVSDSWAATSLSSAPSARNQHTAVWTGQEMVVFGGCCSPSDYGVYYPYNIGQLTTTAISADLPDPSVVGVSVPFSVSVTGTSAQPTAGTVTVTSSTGEVCSDNTASASSGNTALYSCSISFSTPGSRTLTAAYGGSTGYQPSTSTTEAHTVIELPTLSIDDASVLEHNVGTTDLQFVIARSHTLNDVSVQIDTADGTATAGSDYGAIIGSTLNLPAGGATSTTVTVIVNGDVVLEDNEVLLVNLSNASGATLVDAQGSGTIQNDDSASVGINNVSLDEGNAGTTGITFTATLTGAVQGGFSVPVASANGSATAGTDYSAIANGVSLTFAGTAGETQAVSVPVLGETSVELDETFTVVLATPSNPQIALSAASGTGTIRNDDSATVQIAPLSLNQSEAASPMAFVVTLSNPVQAGVTLTVNSAAGTATAADFTAIVNNTVSFASNSTSSQIDVSINDDAIDEDDESFTLTLSNLVAGASVSLGAATATGTIQDDDAPPTLSVSSPSQPEGNAGATPMSFVVSLSAVSGRDVSFTRATADGSATASDNDYVPLPAATATIAAGETNITVPVTINGDTVYEGDQSFSLLLTGVSNATPTSTTGTGTLVDDDQQSTTTTIVSHTPSATVVGEPYTVSVNVAAVSSSPPGSVTIRDGVGPGSASCGPVTLTAGATPISSASCTLTSISAGAKTLTADYSPASGAFAASADSTAHSVNAAGTTISVVGPVRSRINQPTTFSFALGISAPGAGTPAGTVTLSSGANSCQVTMPTATTSCALSFSALGTRTVSAEFVPTDGNFLSSNSSGAGNAQTLVYALADIEINKTDGRATYRPGDLIVYTITVRNLGSDAAANVRVLDNVPTGLTGVVWSCAASGGGSCPQAGGSGNIDALLASFPASAQVTYTMSGNVQGLPLQIQNTALIELPVDTTVEDPQLSNNTATDTDQLEELFRNGFENASVSAAMMSLRQPSAAMRTPLGPVGIRVARLDDANSVALRPAEWRRSTSNRTLNQRARVDGDG